MYVNISVHLKGKLSLLTSFLPSHSWSHPAPNKQPACPITCVYTHPETNPHIDTHISSHPRRSPSFSEAGLAGGDLPLLGGFPGCLINYPTPIVYQEAREEQEKAQNGHCQVGGIHFPGSSAWGVARRGKRKTERPGLWSREERRDREREERGSLAAGIRWYYRLWQFLPFMILKWQWVIFRTFLPTYYRLLFIFTPT